jgi:hypothetical protein
VSDRDGGAISPTRFMVGVEHLQAPFPAKLTPIMKCEPGLTYRQTLSRTRRSHEGFVTLSTAGAGEGDVVASCCYADSLAPSGEGRRPEFSIRVGGNEMAAGVERVVDGGMSG